MAKMNNVDGPANINGVSLGTALQVGPWSARPGTGDGSLGFDDPSDGDHYRVSGSSYGLRATYRYSSTVGEWVRPELYSGSPTLIGRLRGSVLPSAETPAWTHVTADGGAISTDGTKVTFAGPSTNAKAAYAYYQHGVTGGSSAKYHFMQGLVQCTSTGTPSGWHQGRAVRIDSFTDLAGYHRHKMHVIAFDTNAPTASINYRGRYGLEAGTTGNRSFGTVFDRTDPTNDATTEEAYIEFYVGPSGSWAWMNHSITPTFAARNNAMNNTTGDYYVIGDFDTNEVGSMTLRESFWGTFTPVANESHVEPGPGGGS